MSSDSHDLTLIKRVLLGDEAAFDELVDEYYPRLYRFAFRRVGSDPEAAQDVVQSTFEKLIPKLGHFRGEAALFSWICTFCRYEIAAFWKKGARIAPELELEEDSPEVQAALESLARVEATPQEELERKELARLVRVALDMLPTRYSHALEWKYLQGLSVGDISQRLELSSKATESLLTRARQAFRDGFGELVGRRISS